MKLHPILFGSALAALAAQPGIAAVTSITEVSLNPTDTGLEVIFETEGGDNSNVFTVNQGNTLVADMTRTQLDLPSGGGFLQANPAPGISQISVAPLDANSVRVTISGTSQTPIGSVATTDNRVVLSISNDGEAASTPTPVPQDLVTVPPAPAASASLAQATPLEPAEVPTPASPEVLVPNPEIIIDGNPVPQPQERPAPPFLPRAVAPPVGDIAIAEGVPTFNSIDLGSNERIPKLLLRDAPAREVLSLLARAAGLNLIFTAAEAGADQATQGEPASGDGPTVSLDIENESVQEVFNQVLRVSGLEANRVGRSIYVGPSLPVSAQSIASRTLRLNQVNSLVAANFLVALGAESAVSRERLVTIVTAVEVSEGIASSDTAEETQTTTVEQIETQRVEYEDSQPVLRGLQVIADERTNSVTLVGRSDLVAIATEQLTHIDVRRRQVAVNVRVIDIDLNALDAFGTSFSFRTGNFGFTSTGGLGVMNIGAGIPSIPLPPTPPNATPILPRPISPPGGNGTSNSFLFQLLATVQNGNGKIITDPTLIVQEGQTANVKLTQDVVTNITTTIETTPSGNLTTQDIELTPAGLILQIQVNRIDDNGFVSLSVAPSISAPTDTFSDGQGNTFFLLSQRQITSGEVRVRDGQTLLLSGIIQESERSSVTKIPILGDIPILGALFRSTITDNQRQELIVLLTPQILDDSDQSVFGYSYTPSEEVQEILDNRQ
jgi:type IV pilus assembly protein PilQ